MNEMANPIPLPRRRGRPAAEDGIREGVAGVRALDRALALLQAVAARAEGNALTDLADAAGLAPSTAHRLLRGLEERGFVSQDAERGLWFVGVGAFAVGAAFLKVRDVVQIARPAMRRLMERSGESVNLAVLDAGEAVFLSQVECRQMMRALAPPGGRAPLHASGVGKALLMGFGDKERIRRIAAMKLGRHTDYTLIDAAALTRDIEESRLRGFAIDDEEHAVGLRCVAAPIRNEFAEPVAAISISGPKARIEDARLPELGELVARAAAEVSSEYGAVANGATTLPPAG